MEVAVGAGEGIMVTAVAAAGAGWSEGSYRRKQTKNQSAAAAESRTRFISCKPALRQRLRCSTWDGSRIEIEVTQIGAGGSHTETEKQRMAGRSWQRWTEPGDKNPHKLVRPAVTIGQHGRRYRNPDCYIHSNSHPPNDSVRWESRRS